MILDIFRNMFNNEISIEERIIEDVIIIRAFQCKKKVGQLQGQFKENGKVLLADIDNRGHINQGVGSALINKFEDICREKGIKEIYGNLANVDLDHKDRLIHFYKKHGYSIVEEKEEKSYWGKISKEL